jgi:hypothetical protein
MCSRRLGRGGLLGDWFGTTCGGNEVRTLKKELYRLKQSCCARFGKYIDRVKLLTVFSGNMHMKINSTSNMFSGNHMTDLILQ